MYHTKRCPKFLLLPKCPKLKQVTESPRCKQKVTRYKTEAHTAGRGHGRSHGHGVARGLRPGQAESSCACIKMHINIFLKFIFIIKQMDTLSTINNPPGAPRGPGGRCPEGPGARGGVFLVIAGDARDR